jgi:CheY-like chemotaxis protein
MVTSNRPLKNILIVEDDLDIREALAQILELEGYQVACADNGRDALSQLTRSARPDLIILDIMMPVMDGWQFREEQKKNPALSPIPVIVISADGNACRSEMSREVAGCLQKPVELDAFIDTVKRNCPLP